MHPTGQVERLFVLIHAGDDTVVDAGKLEAFTYSSSELRCKSRSDIEAWAG